MRSVQLILLSFISGFSAELCNFDLRLSQALQNQGFHRNITYTVKMNDLHEECYIGLDQPLPAGIYAYPEELGDLRRMNKLTAIPKNRVNVELPAQQAQPTSVFLIGRVTKGEANLWLPVHARYHQAAKGGGFVHNNIVPPRIFLRCARKKLDCEPVMSLITFLCNGSGKETCIWREVPARLLTDAILPVSVPIGNQDHTNMVAPVTVITVIICSLYLLKTLHEYKLASIKKAAKL